MHILPLSLVAPDLRAVAGLAGVGHGLEDVALQGGVEIVGERLPAVAGPADLDALGAFVAAQ